MKNARTLKNLAFDFFSQYELAIDYGDLLDCFRGVSKLQSLLILMSDRSKVTFKVPPIDLDLEMPLVEELNLDLIST